MLKSKYLFFITGSIAAFKAAQVISRLVQDGCEVQVLATPSALKFVGAATFEGLTGRAVLSDLWESGRAMDHIHLSRWADCGVVCPASANTIAQMSLGLASDVVSATLLAWPKGKPLFVFPAMNSEMLSADSTQEHLATLRKRGIKVADAASGNLACGEVGSGRLLEPEQILQILAESASGIDTSAPKSWPGPSFRSASVKELCANSVLITGGATRESIDGIRFLSNLSTGRTAAELCDRFSAFGWSVTYLHGQSAVLPHSHVNNRSFTDVSNLDQILREQLSQQDFDAVIHCAAVSDHTVELVNGAVKNLDTKMTSEQELILKLKPTPKILPNLKEYSKNKSIRVVGFKLTLNQEVEQQANAAKKILSEGIDAIVANDWSQIKDEKHPGFVLDHDGKETFNNVAEMALILNRTLQPKDLV